jgi:hypothetical protein
MQRRLKDSVDGHAVYVTGVSTGNTPGEDFTTIAYRT